MTQVEIKPGKRHFPLENMQERRGESVDEFLCVMKH